MMYNTFSAHHIVREKLRVSFFVAAGVHLPIHTAVGPFLYEQRETAPPWSVGWLANSNTAAGQHTDNPFSGPREETTVRDLHLVAPLILTAFDYSHHVP